jgi:hypothetical protein
MAVDQSFKDLCKWVALTLVVIVVTFWYFPGLGQQDSTFGMFVVALLFTIQQAWERFIVWRLSNVDYLEKTANDLWHAAPLKQLHAMYRLGLVVGARFGSTSIWSGRHHATRCELWRAWWERHAGNLVWDRELAAYVEDSVAVDE